MDIRTRSTDAVAILEPATQQDEELHSYSTTARNPEPSHSMTTEEVEHVTAAMNAVRSIVRSLRVSSRMIEGRMGMSGAQLFVLQQLAERPANSLNELADRTATHQSSVSVVVRRLVDHGYVSRTTAEGDRRRVELALTDKGREVLAGAPTTVQVKLLRGARALTPAEKETLARLMQEWVQASGLEDGAPPLLMGVNGDTPAV